MSWFEEYREGERSRRKALDFWISTSVEYALLLAQELLCLPVCCRNILHTPVHLVIVSWTSRIVTRTFPNPTSIPANHIDESLLLSLYSLQPHHLMNGSSRRCLQAPRRSIRALIRSRPRRPEKALTLDILSQRYDREVP